jgi:6,7-dimethyl-8-ribityllumazine synthase
MLKKVKKTAARKHQKIGGLYAIIASSYNRRYVDSMLGAAQKFLEHAGAEEIRVLRVPGSFEIPVVATRLARGIPRYSAIICLGVIIRGQTAHAQLIAEAVTRSIAGLQVEQELPIIHEVLLVENEDQARVRCLDAKHNRGAEAAQTAVRMVQLMRTL